MKKLTVEAIIRAIGIVQLKRQRDNQPIVFLNHLRDQLIEDGFDVSDLNNIIAA